MGNRGRQGGFTLLEMILAMTLVGLIMAMAYTGLRSSARSSERGEDFIDRTNRLRVAQQFIRQQVSRALPLRIQDDPDDATDFVLFEGERDFMRFVAPMPGYLGFGGPQVQIFEIDRGAEGDRLLFNHYLLNANDGLEMLADPDRDPILLLDGIRDARFSYVVLNEEDEVDDWVDEWEDTTVTPLAVRVEIEMLPETKMNFPTMEIPLVLDGAATRRPGITDFSRPQRIQREQEIDPDAVIDPGGQRGGGRG